MTNLLKQLAVSLIWTQTQERRQDINIERSQTNSKYSDAVMMESRETYKVSVAKVRANVMFELKLSR